MISLVWFTVIATIAVNALFVAAEFSAVSVRHSRIRSLADAGNGLAKLLLQRIADTDALDRYIACCQVGITFSSVLLGAAAQASLTVGFAPLLEDWFSINAAVAMSSAAVIVLVGLTVSQMVIGELMPKTLALQFPTQTALLTVVPMNWSMKLFSPFIDILNGSGNVVLGMMGMRSGGHRHIHSPEEIELLIVESRDGGLLEPEEHRRLQQALRLNQCPASQLMVARLHMVTIGADVPQNLVLRRVAESPYSRFPVTRGSKDNVIGVLYAKDVIAHYVEHGQLPSVQQLMRPMFSVPRSVTADRLLTLMREHHCQQALLVDEYGGVEGIVTMEDVLTEVFGEFADEFKKPDRGPETLDDGSIRAPGLTRLDELEPLLGVRLEGDVATIGGLVLNTLGRLPVKGDRLTIQGIEIQVEALSRHAVASVLLRQAHAPADDEQSEEQSANG